MIHISGITKRYGTTTVLDSVDLQIQDGGVTSLIGANGAGKSTLLSIVGRLLDPDSGRVEVDGMDVATTPGPTLATHLAILRQENHLPVRLTVRELVEFGRYPHCGVRLGAQDHDHVDFALDQMLLADLADRRLDQLSGGQRQRAFIAMVLSQNTTHVLLDEPLNNLDMRHAAGTMGAIRSMADELGKTVVVVVHDVNVAAAYSDHVVALRHGQIAAVGTPSEVITRQMLGEVFDLDVPVREIDGHRISMHFAPTQPAYAAANGKHVQ